jgi:hypothetical protein
VDDLEISEDARVDEAPVPATIQGQSAAVATVRGTSDDDGTPYLALVAAILNEDRLGIALATIPESGEAEFRPTVQAIVDTLRVSRPASAQVEPIDAGTITYGETVNGSVDEAGAIVRWEFTAAAGDVINVVATPLDSDFDLTLNVLDDQEQSLVLGGHVDSSLGAERIENLTIDQAGDYWVAVTGYQGAVGDYELLLELTGSSTIPVGEEPGVTVTFSGSVPGNGEFDLPFTGLRGATLTAVVDPSSNLDAVVEIRAFESDALIEEVDSSFGTEELTFELPREGNYILRIRGFTETGGDFEATVSGPPDIVFELVEGAQVTGFLGPDGHLFFAWREAGTSLSLTVQPTTDAIDIAVEVFGLDNEVLQQVDDGLSGEAENVQITVPEQGYYMFRIYDFFEGTGPFELTIN